MVEGLESGIQYEYQVAAVNSTQKSALSNIITVTTERLEIPTAIAATNITDHSFTARWNAVSGATKYKIEFYINGSWHIQFSTTTSFSYNFV